MSENQARHESAIRDLIVVSRTFLESQKQTSIQIQELRESQQQSQREWREIHRELVEADRKLAKRIDALREASAETQEKLNALIEVVDRIIGSSAGKTANRLHSLLKLPE